MRTTTFSVNKNDVKFLQTDVARRYTSAVKKYENNPERYADDDKDRLLANFLSFAKDAAIFALFERDELASITKEKDEFYQFSDHAGDCYCPIANPDIDAGELKKQERRERARFNRQGVYFHTLVVAGQDIDSIGGFVGDDFYGSGYDQDFYFSAIEILSLALPDYIKAINEVVAEIK